MVVKRLRSNTISFLRKLRFLDYLILLALILGGIVFFLFLHPKEKWIEAKISANNLSIFQTRSLKIGDIEKDSSGKKIAEITGLQIYDTPRNITANKDVYMTLRILVRINPRSGELEYKNKIIKVGSPVDFRFSQGFISAKIAQLQGDEQKVEMKTITVKLYDQWPWLADSIKIGAGETDQTGQKIIEVLSKDVKPAEVTVTTQNGQDVLTIDPQKVDITLTAKIQIINSKGEYMFRQDERVIVGELISFNAGNTRVKEAYIVNIE